MYKRNVEKIRREVRISLSMISKLSEDEVVTELAKLELLFRGIHLRRLIDGLYREGFSLHSNLSPVYPIYAEDVHYRDICEKILTGLHTIREMPYDIIKGRFNLRYVHMGLSWPKGL